ncbi:hypothetical protein OfM1_11920 [Lactovum odontotermitis]
MTAAKLIQKVATVQNVRGLMLSKRMMTTAVKMMMMMAANPPAPTPTP